MTTYRRRPTHHGVTAGLSVTLTLGALSLGAPAAVAAPPVRVELPGDKVFPESVTSTMDGTLYVGSIPNGGVMKAKPGAAKAETFIKPGAAGSRSTFGVFADERAGILWICSNDASALGVSGPNDIKGSFLKGFDLKTSTNKVSVRLPGEKTLCNDIAVGPDGSVYVSNSLAPAILRLKPGAKQFEVWASDPLFEPPAKGGAGLDGIAFGEDGNLYITKFTEAALLRVDVKDGAPGKVTKLETTRPLVLADALRPAVNGGGFLMIEGEGRLDRVTVNGNSAKIDVLKADLNGPTGVAQAGNTAWVSEGQLPVLFGGKGGPKLPFTLRSVPVPTP